AADMAIDISGTIVDIQKMMAAEPRRISGIKVVVNFPDRYFDDKTRKILEHTALTCPVAKSLHPDILQDIHFIWSDSPSI
ncbi:MAG: OsmC family peroxiredoxin, partial [Bacteroidota bacterium]